MRPFDAKIGTALSWADVQNYFPKSQFQTHVKLIFERTTRHAIGVRYLSNGKDLGGVELERVQMPSPSRLAAKTEVTSWRSFKAEIDDLPYRQFIFRGQDKPYPLQTSFHRTKRKNILSYMQEDIQALNRSISSRLNHVFNFSAGFELGAFLNLAQHHGFPTPLLDWTYSPFVAAWFAFDGVSLRRRGGRKSDDVVRIFCLNRDAFIKIPQFDRITFSVPHTSLLEALAIENERAIPQQGLLMLTNLQDVESHIKLLEKNVGEVLLTAYDIPASEANIALKDLAKMGITRSTLMPSIESTCLEMKGRLF